MNLKPEKPEHKWLHMVDKLATAIYQLRYEEYLDNVDLPVPLKREVRVCLIDDGVDFEQREIMDRIEQGKEFGAAMSPDQCYPTISKPYHFSTTSHGTLMAKMIARVCPNVRITPYRIETFESYDREITFTPVSAVKVSSISAKR